MLANESYMALYVIGVICMLIACRYAVCRTDRTGTLPALPIPPQLDPRELAYLRGGKRAVERLAILELLQSGHLRARRQEASFWRSRPERTFLEQAREGNGLASHMSVALRRFSTPQVTDKIGDLWGDLWPGMQSKLDDRLNQDQLLMTDATASASRAVKAVAALALIAWSVPLFPEIKALFWKGPVFCTFLALFLIAAVFAVDRLSRRGKDYLARLQQAQREKKATAALAPSTAAGVAAVTLTVEFALLGAEGLKDTPYEGIDAMADSDDGGDGGDGGDD